MAYTTLSDLFKGICDAIRAKDGTTGTINHQDIPTRISAITTGGTSADALSKAMIDKSVTAITADELSGITKIGKYAFAQCNKLTSVVIPNNITTIGAHSFEFSGLTSIVIPDSVTELGYEKLGPGGYCFYICVNLQSVTLPNNIKTIYDSTFRHCDALKNITIPSSVTKIEQSAFSSSGLSSIVIPNTVSSIGSAAFSYCSSLSSITLSNSITELTDTLFYGCTALTGITIPNTVNKIGYWSFGGCTGLISIEIPASVTVIDSSAFSSCTNLKTITVHNASGVIQNAPWGATNASIIYTT